MYGRSYDIHKIIANEPLRSFLTILVLLLCGLGIGLGMVCVELIKVPAGWQSCAQIPYRIAFLATMPLRFVLKPGVGNGYLCSFICGTALPFMAFAVYKVKSFIGRRSRDADRRGGEEALSRRHFLQRAASGAAFAGMGGLAVEGALLEPQRLRIREYTVPVSGLPQALDGLRIAHISDTHYGPFVSLAFLRSVVAQANALHPDLIVLTGDYVHKTERAIADGVALFQNLESRLGIAAVLGNHDHWESTAECEAAFRKIGVPLIDNRRLFLSSEGLRENGRSGECIGSAGAGDLWTDEVLLRQALSEVPGEMPRLLLSHNPDVAELPDIRGHRIDLMLSGHTHGGQVALPFLGTPIVPSQYGQKYSGGLVHGPACPVLVSRGVGMALLPVRIGVPPEMGLLVLRKA
ncbi:MAG: metallophosphoesterase [Candidatus Hydrogenedentes bacterium]|nr:metallophosphoesterase [Candidatus Hydrogenedentota bacterium]